MLKYLLWILNNDFGGTLAITRKVASTAATAAAMNTNYDEIEAVVNGGLDGDNLDDDGVTAAKLNVDVVRANYGLAQHTDGSLYVSLHDTPGLELSGGKLRVDAYGILSLTSDGVIWGRSGDCVLSSSTDTPDGFTDVSATYANKFIRVSATALSTGGSDTWSGTTDSHTLTATEMPAHTHAGVTTNGNTAPADSTVRRLNNSGYGENQAPFGSTSSAGSDGGHTHTITNADTVPSYVSLKMYMVT